jgi:23S rRNA pseudouridine1911/1915/1917 synthase
VAGCAAPAIVYEDADLLVVEKPAGMVVHPAFGHHGDTLLDALAMRTPSVPAPEATPQPRPIHRLDKDTSGLLVLARTLQAHRYLSYQWRRQTVVRCYLALVRGCPEPPEGAIELPLARDPQNRQRVIPTPEGQAARTLYTTLEQYAGYSLLDVQLETGRMHQIRVHLAARGHPIAGDVWYGDGAALPGLARQFLHAHRLVIRLPSTRQLREFGSTLPPDLAAVLAELRPTPAATGN